MLGITAANNFPFCAKYFSICSIPLFYLFKFLSIYTIPAALNIKNEGRWRLLLFLTFQIEFE